MDEYDRDAQEIGEYLYDPLPEGLVEQDWLQLPEIEQDWLQLPEIEQDWLDAPSIEQGMPEHSFDDLGR